MASQEWDREDLFETCLQSHHPLHGGQWSGQTILIAQKKGEKKVTLAGSVSVRQSTKYVLLYLYTEVQSQTQTITPNREILDISQSALSAGYLQTALLHWQWQLIFRCRL